MLLQHQNDVVIFVVFFADFNNITGCFTYHSEYSEKVIFSVTEKVLFYL